tara:strand:+ start:853 stop:1023 length:171 start_codon:yes stop_codon:yes gene_type:complete
MNFIIWKFSAYMCCWGFEKHWSLLALRFYLRTSKGRLFLDEERRYSLSRSEGNLDV